MGPSRGEATIYNWKWYHNMPALALWLVLALAVAVVKENRTLRALVILVPLLAVSVLWIVFRNILGFRSSDLQMFNMVFYSLAAGITMIWLLAHKLGNCRGVTRFFLALLIMVLATLVGGVSFGIGFSGATAQVLLLPGLLAIAMLLAFALSSWRCRRRYTRVRFMLWLALWSVAACTVAMLAYVGVYLVIEAVSGELPDYWAPILIQVSLTAIIFGLFVYVMNVPYLVLAFVSPFFGDRFRACLKFKSTESATAQRSDLG